MRSTHSARVGSSTAVMRHRNIAHPASTWSSPRSSIGTRSTWMPLPNIRSEEHTSELQSLMRISYAVFCLKKKKTKNSHINYFPSLILYKLLSYISTSYHHQTYI